MKKTFYTIVILFIALQLCNAQNSLDLSLLNGNWIGKEILDPANDPKLITGAELAENETNYQLIFSTNDTVYFKEPSAEGTYTYSVTSNNVLTINNEEYIVLVLDQTQLRLRPVETSTQAILYFNKTATNGY